MHYNTSSNYQNALFLLLCPPLSSSSQKIRITPLLTVFLKHGQMDFSKASNSISHRPTSIFPKKMMIMPKMPKITKNAKNHQKCQKPPIMSKITKNAKILPKMPKITKNTKNHQKCQKSLKMTKTTKNSKKSPKMMKMPNRFGKG